MDTVEAKISSSTTREEYVFWKTIQSYNTTSQYISNLFNGITTYDAYIEQYAPDFYNQIKVIFAYNLSDPLSNTTFSTTLANIIAAFTSFLSGQSGGICNIPTKSQISNGGDTSLQSIQALLTEFVSLYTELYKVEYDELFNDSLENTIHPLYFLYQETKNMQDTIKLLPLENIKSDALSYFMSSGINWIEEIFSFLFTKFQDSIIPQNDDSRYKLVTSSVDASADDILDLGEKLSISYTELRMDKPIITDQAVWN